MSFSSDGKNRLTDSTGLFSQATPDFNIRPTVRSPCTQRRFHVKLLEDISDDYLLCRFL